MRRLNLDSSADSGRTLPCVCSLHVAMHVAILQEKLNIESCTEGRWLFCLTSPRERGAREKRIDRKFVTWNYELPQRLKTRPSDHVP